MPERDPQTIALSRQSILLVTAVSVGLLTLSYVLGVQVGKQSAALRQPLSKGTGEELQDLPASLSEQLKILDADDSERAPKTKSKPQETRAETAAEPTSKPAAKPTDQDKKVVPKGGADSTAADKLAAEKKAADKKAADKKAADKKVADKKAKDLKDAKEAETDGSRWMVQLVSTPDSDEADRVAAKAKSDGFATTTLSEKGAFKVRITKPGSREDIDALSQKLKERGFRTYPIKLP